MNGTAFQWLDDATLHAVWKAAIELNLSRDTVVPRSVSAMMPTSNRPGDQHLRDLQYLNAIEALADGSVPLRSWLETALLLHGHRREAMAFTRALEKLSRGDEGGDKSPPPGTAPPGGSRPLWKVVSVTKLLQHPDRARLVDVMKSYASTRGLRDVAGQAGIDVSRVDWGESLDHAARDLVEESFTSNQLEALVEHMSRDPAIAKWHGTLITILGR